MRIRDWSSDVCSSDLLLSADHTASWLQPAQHLNRTAFLPGVTWSDGLRSLWAGQQTMPYEPRQWPPISATIRRARASTRSEEHTSELQSLMRISYAVFCLKKKNNQTQHSMMNNNKHTN